MAVHWRTGFRRLLRALTWVYWSIVGVIALIAAREAMMAFDAGDRYTLHWDRWREGYDAIGGVVSWSMVIFAILWAITSALRWIARGFADGEA